MNESSQNILVDESDSTIDNNTKDKLKKCPYCSKDFSGSKWHKLNIQRHVDMHKKLTLGNKSIATFFSSNTPGILHII
jgi:hypothetical protein